MTGSAVAFIAIYATRLGAATWQIGFLTAGPALINLIFTLPAGQWVARRHLVRTVFWTSIGQRLIYPLLVLVALLQPPELQIWSIIGLVLLTSIPGAALAIAFNALFAEAVPERKRGEVVGRRNALLALMVLISSLVSGQLLRTLPPEQGYPLVFALGTMGAIFSSYHLWRVHLDNPIPTRAWKGAALGDAERSGRVLMLPDMPLSRTFATRVLTRVQDIGANAVLAPLRTAFGPFVFALFAFHFAQYVPLPLFPLFWVREAHLDDGAISILNAVFYTVMLIASLRLGALTLRFGSRRLMVVGAFLLSLYPLLTALSTDIRLLLAASIVGGCVWAVLGGALANRLLERVPDTDRPTYLALYNLALNAAMLLGALLGSLLADAYGLRETLLIATGLRIGAGFLLLRFG